MYQFFKKISFQNLIINLLTWLLEVLFVGRSSSMSLIGMLSLPDVPAFLVCLSLPSPGKWLSEVSARRRVWATFSMTVVLAVSACPALRGRLVFIDFFALCLMAWERKVSQFVFRIWLRWIYCGKWHKSLIYFIK